MNDEKRLNGMFAAKLEEGMEKARAELLKNLLEQDRMSKRFPR